MSSRLSVLAYFLTGGELAPILSTKRAALLPRYAYEVQKLSSAFGKTVDQKLLIAKLVELVATV